MMQVQVETRSGHGGVEVPRRFSLDGREIEAVDTLDQWYGRHDRYFKIRSADGDLYILRFDELGAEWELVMFQRKELEAPPVSSQPSNQPEGN